MKLSYCFLLIAALLFAFAPASDAQVDYDTVASLADLMDGGNQADIEIDCMDTFSLADAVGVDHPLFIFYNEATGDLVGHEASAPPGSRTFIIVDSATLDAELGGDVTDCRALKVTQFGDIYAALSVGGVDYVYYISVVAATESGCAQGGCGIVLAEADGITGIDVAEQVPTQSGIPPVLLAMVEFFGADEDGFYELVPAKGPFPFTPDPICTDPGLDLYDLVFFEGNLLSNSSEFGDAGAGLQNVSVAVLPGAGGSCVAVIYDPFADTPPGTAIFTNGTDGGIEDIEFVGFGGGGAPFSGGNAGAYLFNNSFGATDGEQWGVTFNGTDGVRFAEQTPMLADPDVDIVGYDAPDGTHMSVMDDGTTYVASISAFGGGDAIIVFFGVPVPVELLSFDAVVDGNQVTLNWATGSETNNAGFEVQMQHGTNWDVLGWVEGHGTTTEARTYSFSAELLPGTYAFRLKQIDFDGQFEYFGNLEATIGTPGTHLLSSVYPNPFNPQASFDLAVAQAQHVSVELYNLLGQRVSTLFSARMEADATQTITIYGADLATGQYLIRVTGERFVDGRRVTLLK